MFGRSKPVVLQSYGYRRSGPRVPAWLVLLVLGIAIGVGAVLLLQKHYLPPRLTAEASAELIQDYETAEAERQRLSRDLAEASRQLETSRADQQRLGQDLASSRESADKLRTDLDAVVDHLPPDPRDTPVSIRAARLGTDQGALTYELVLSRAESAGEAFNGVLQFFVAGTTAGGTRTTVSLEPVSVRVGRFESLRGRVPMPEGFAARQTTLQVLDKPEGTVFGRRVLNLR